MRISAIDKEYTKEEATSANAYVAVDSETLGTGKIKLSELSNGEGSGGGSGYGSDWYIVNFSFDSNSKLVADKTHDEIKQWFEANGTMSYTLIKGVFMTSLFNINSPPEDYQTLWTFECPMVSVINGVPILNYGMITLSDTNEVSFTSQQYTLQTVSEV